MSDSLWPYRLQHSRPLCPSLSQSLLKLMSIESMMPSNHLILHRPLLFLPSASGSFIMSWLLASGGQSIEASTSASVLPMNIQGLFPLGLTDLVSLQSKGLSRVFSSTTVQKHQFFGAQPSLWSNSHIHTWLLEKTIALIIWTFVGKVMSLLFNMLLRFVIAFLPRNERLLISWLWSLPMVILEPKERKSVTVSIVSPSICHELMGLGAMILLFWMLNR